MCFFVIAIEPFKAEPIQKQQSNIIVLIVKVEFKTTEIVTVQHNQALLHYVVTQAIRERFGCSQ